MKQFLRSGLLMIAACVASGLSLHAQTVLYATDFPDDQGWTFTANQPPFAWNVDATPTSVLGSPSWRSAPYSLNFNDGHTCGAPIAWVATIGTATSPPIDLSVATGDVHLELWCMWDTEGLGGCGGYDRRILKFLNASGQVGQHCFTDCAPPGQWHFHSLALDVGWDLVQAQFYFNTLDGFDNDGAGWFIDDLEVIAGCLVDAPYCTPKLNSLGCSPTIFTTGTPSLSGSGQAFRIWAGSVLNQKVGLMLWSKSPASTPFGGGTLCVAAPITRTAAQNSGGTSLPAQDCTGTYVLQFTPAMMSQAGLLVGDDVYSQYWSRDNGFPPPDNVGLTAGVHWEICP